MMANFKSKAKDEPKSFFFSLSLILPLLPFIFQNSRKWYATIYSSFPWKGFLKREGFKLCLFSYHIQNNAVLVTAVYSPKIDPAVRTKRFIFISYKVRVGLKACSICLKRVFQPNTRTHFLWLWWCQVSEQFGETLVTVCQHNSVILWPTYAMTPRFYPEQWFLSFL